MPAVDFLMAMFEAGKPVAAICHGPWTLIEGDLVAGRTLTSWPSLQTDLRNAGAYWVDRDVVVCSAVGINTLVTSRKPDDLDAFCREITAVFAPAGVPRSSFAAGSGGSVPGGGVPVGGVPGGRCPWRLCPGRYFQNCKRVCLEFWKVPSAGIARADVRQATTVHTSGSPIIAVRTRWPR